MLELKDNFYQPVSATIIWFLISTGLFVGYFLARWLLAKFFKARSLKTQKSMMVTKRSDTPVIIQNALRKIDELYQLSATNVMPVHKSAEQMSFVCRETFDYLMNHRSQYSTKYENKIRNLLRIGESQDVAYPLEFDVFQAGTLNELADLASKSKEVIKSCS